ncbi:MAG: ABC transporter ATP-binding protein [Magnetospirillum sp.]|nr:ABC transporter ATP-binding protein [Magnetospirillum sp.]
MGAAIIELDDVTLGYERHPAVHHLRGGFASGTLTAVVGPNGGGKSTLLKGVIGLLRPLSGRISVNGVDRRDIAYLPQQADIDPRFPISVLDTVLLGHWRRMGAFRPVTRAMRAAGAAALAAVGLEGFEARPIGSLSAGQRQRALFARVLVADSPVILLDEPFTAIDAKTTADLLALVLRWHGEGRTIVAVLHDHDQVRRYFPQTLLLAREAIGWGDTEAVLTPDNLRHVRAMSEAWDTEAPVCERGAA